MHFTKRLAGYENNPCTAIYGSFYKVGAADYTYYAFCGKRRWRYDVKMMNGSSFSVEATTKRGCIVAIKRLIRKAM